MINLRHDKISSILCLGSHADDIEIGCGGTLLKLLAENPDIAVTWVVLSGNEHRREEARQSAEQFLERTGSKQIIIKDFPDSFFPYDGEPIKRFIHQLQQENAPDVVFTHRREDMHQDHRIVAEITWNAFRNHLIMEYEIPKYEGDLGQPNVYVPLEEPVCRRKIDSLLNAFPTQQTKPWFSADTFWALLRIRGLECHSPSRFAEGLYCRKMTL